MPAPIVRRLTEYVPLTKAQFRERFMARFYGPALLVDEPLKVIDPVSSISCGSSATARSSRRT